MKSGAEEFDHNQADERFSAQRTCRLRTGTRVMTAPRLIWLGPVVDRSEVKDSVAISAAANHWQRCVIKTLERLGNEVLVVGHRPERVWPIGKLRPIQLREDSDLVKVQLRYLNVPFFNRWHLDYLYEEAIQQRAAGDTVIMTYNWSPSKGKIKRLRQEYRKLKWVAIVADGSPPVGADCTVFLSRNGYLRANTDTSLHFEGGVEEMCAEVIPKAKVKHLVYAGEYSNLTGIRKFIRQFSDLKLRDIELHLYGKIPAALCAELTAGYKNIKTHGFVPAEELNKSLEGAWAFVNPRDETLEDELNTFPSKLLLYFKYGKPIISTLSAGIPPIYARMLTTYSPKSQESLRKAIDLVCSLSDAEYHEVYERTRTVLETQTWHRVVCNLVKELRLRGIEGLRCAGCEFV